MKRALAALLAVHLGACATEAEPPGYGEGLGTPDNPVPRDDVAYTVTSHVGAEIAPIPPAVTATVARLRAFAAAPADTLVAIAQGATMPEVAQLYAELPLTLSSRLKGWIDVEIDKLKISTMSVRQFATGVSTFAETALTRYSVDSTMSFTPTQTQHSLRALRFRLAGFDVVVPIGGLKADAVAQTPDVSVAEAGAVTFGQQTFGVAFGSHAWHAVNLASTQLYGAEVLSTLTRTIDCRVLGQAVAARCYNAVCVGHQAQLTAVCDKTVQLLVSELATRVAEHALDELHIASGAAQLIDNNIDGLADSFEGAWDLDTLSGSSRVKFTAEAIR